MATHHRDFERMRNSIDFDGGTIVDHTHHLAEDVDHPENRAAKNAYQDHVHGDKMVAALQGVHDEGSSPKTFFRTPTHNFLVKPYHEATAPNLWHAIHYPYAGWAEMTTQGLFHAGGLGHLTQRVHTTVHPISETEHAPFYAVHLDNERTNEAHKFHEEKLEDPARPGEFKRPAKMYDDLARIGFIDFLTGNIDRHSGNMLYQKPLPGQIPQHVLAIDHSYNFQYKSPPLDSQAASVDQKPHDHLFYYLPDAHGISSFARHGMTPWDAQHIKTATEWWREHGRNLRHEFDRHLMAVTEPKVAKWLSKNFNARADALDRFSLAYSAAPDPDFYVPWGEDARASKVARVPMWKHHPVFPFNDLAPSVDSAGKSWLHHQPVQKDEEDGTLEKMAPKASLPSQKQLLAHVSDRECYDVAQGVSNRFPALHYDAGFYMHNGRPADHAWTKAPDGTIYDTTHSQFNPKVKVGIFKPGTPEHGRYRSYDEHHPANAPGFCLLRTLGRDEPCEAPGCDWKGTLAKGDVVQFPHARVSPAQDLGAPAKVVDAPVHNVQAESAQNEYHNILDRVDAAEAQQNATRKFQPGNRVMHVDRTHMPWPGTVGLARYRDSGEDGPGHYYEVDWQDPRGVHTDFVHQNRLTTHLTVAKSQPGGTCDTLQKMNPKPKPPADFKQWFAGSHVVDEKGAPLLAYHGSEMKRIKQHRTPAYFTNKPDFASSFGPQMHRAHLRIRNPYVINGQTDGRHFEWDAEDVARMKGEGHDGVIIRHPEGDVYTVFDPDQIRLPTP